MANARPMFILVFLFAGLLANAQPSTVQNGGQQSSQQASALADQSTQASEQAPNVALVSTDGAAPAAVADASKEKPVAIMSAKVIFDQRYTQLRRGHDQEVAVLLCSAKPGECWFNDTTIKNPPVPISLQMDHAEGFTIRYGAPRHYESKAQGTPSYRGDRRLIFLKVHASSDVGLGEHVLKGTMVFRAGSNSSKPETLAIEVRVNVADHDAPEMELDWPYIHHPGRVAGDVASGVGRATLLIVLLPFLPIYGLIMCGSIDCHD
jgi:hypothetical protein